MTMQRIGLTVQQLQELEARKKNTLEIARQREETRIIQLPLWREDRRGSPNSFLRSALFAAVQSKDRVYLEDAVLFSQKGYSVKFTGKQLNQEDMTVWLALVDLAKLHPLGTECSFTAYGILKHIGLKDGGRERERLHIIIERMTACMVKIENDRSIYGGNLVHNFSVDKETKCYRLQLNRDLIKLFGEHDWTALNWDQRKQLRQKPLAQKLHEYFSSHEFPKPVTIEFLHSMTGSNTKKIFKFKQSLKTALDELVKITFLESYHIEGEKVTVKRVHKAPTERKYLGN
jgi:TrfA protein